MKFKIFILALTLLSVNLYSQLKISTYNELKINHGDITLYLSNDTLSLVSRHDISYINFNKLTHERDNRWFDDGYNKYDRKYYRFSGYDLGHLTPSDITSYSKVVNHNSFSLYNQAPQLAGFNRGKWSRLEKSVYDSINKYKSNAIIITGVIYDSKKDCYLPKSKIRIPSSYIRY
jgi:DNA/RNA endonuclease G (NUC1)